VLRSPRRASDGHSRSSASCDTDLGETLSAIEGAVKGLTAANCSKVLLDAGVSSEVLAAAAST
jgi:hypothetical protein